MKESLFLALDYHFHIGSVIVFLQTIRGQVVFFLFTKANKISCMHFFFGGGYLFILNT